MNIIALTDFSARASDALKVAAALARKLDVPMRLVHAFDVESAKAVFSGSAQSMEAIARDKLRALARTLREEGAFVVEQFVQDSPRIGLLSVINESIEESFVVMSALGWRSQEGELGVGSVTEAVAASSKSPVLIVRDPAPLLQWIERGESLDVVVAVDRSQSTRAAAEWIGETSRIGPCRVEGIHVTWSDSDDYQKALALDFEESFERTSRFKIPVSVILNAARPADALTALAVRKKSDLLVVGAHEKGGETRWHQSIPYALLELAPMSVAVIPATRVRADVREAAFRTIVVATDLTPVGNRAVAYAYSIAHGCTIHLLNVLVPVVATDPTYGGPVELSAEELDEFRLKARDAVRKLVPAWSDDSTEIHVVVGRDVAEEIRGLADRVSADLICLASHERGRVARWIVGSIAKKVVDRAGRPVLVVCGEAVAGAIEVPVLR